MIASIHHINVIIEIFQKQIDFPCAHVHVSLSLHRPFAYLAFMISTAKSLRYCVNGTNCSNKREKKTGGE